MSAKEICLSIEIALKEYMIIIFHSIPFSSETCKMFYVTFTLYQRHDNCFSVNSNIIRDMYDVLYTIQLVSETIIILHSIPSSSETCKMFYIPFTLYQRHDNHFSFKYIIINNNSMSLLLEQIYIDTTYMSLMMIELNK